MQKEFNKQLVRQVGLNPLKPDTFQLTNEPLINNLTLWSEEDISLDETIQKFFNVKVRTKLLAVLLDLDLNSWVGIGASWQENNHTGQIRIDSKFTEFALNKAFGVAFSNQPFDIKKLNAVELAILQTFLENIETEMKKHWEIDTKHPFLMDTIYLVWIVESEEGEIGRIAFGVPGSFKPKNKSEEIRDITDINKLAQTGINIPINLGVGKTKLTYKEISSLERGDLLVFEDSDTSKLNWHFGEIGTVLPEEDNPVYLHDIENIIDLENEMTEKTFNMSDPLSSLPLELSAEFQKVKISLKKVLELKSGGVLPLGPILETELTLTAQGKPVAKGELVIVGNQFGMRIHDLLIGAAQVSAQKTKSTSIKQEPEEELMEEETEEDEETTFEDELKDLEEEN